jgi:hypothetical protein
LHDHGHDDDFSGPETVDEGTGHGTDRQGEDRHRTYQKTRDPERNVADLVQVDDEKRKCQASTD